MKVLLPLFPHNQLSSKLTHSSVSCFVLDGFRIYTRDLLVAETSRYPAGIEHWHTRMLNFKHNFISRHQFLKDL